MNWNSLRAFVEVARTGSVTGAARRLDMSIPTVRRHILTLEAHCGMALFERSTRGLAPTRVGQRLSHLAEAMEAGPRHAERLFGSAPDTVSVAATEMFGAVFLAPICAALRRADDGAAIDLTTVRDHAELPPLDADVNMAVAPPAATLQHARHLGRMELGLFAHRAYLDAYGVPRSAADLTGHRLIGLESQSANRDYQRRLGLGGRLPPPTFSSESRIILLSAVKAGVGVGLVPVAHARADPDLARVLPDMGLALEVWLWPGSRGFSRERSRLVYDQVARAMSDQLKPQAA